MIMGWDGEGVGEVLQDCTATFKDSYRIFKGEAVSKGATFVVNTWYSKINADNSYSKIPESYFTHTIADGVFPRFVSTTFTTQLRKGDLIARFASSDVKDGYYLQSTGPSQRMIETQITLKELKQI